MFANLKTLITPATESVAEKPALIAPKTRIWFDTEFIEDGVTIDLISIGLVREDGAVLYLENNECDLSKASPWVAEHVIPQLRGGIYAMSRMEIRDLIVSFVTENPEFWANHASYDWVALCQLFGTMMQLPPTWPRFCLDIKQIEYLNGNVKLPEQASGLHDALADARWNKLAWDFLQQAGFLP